LDTIDGQAGWLVDFESESVCGRPCDLTGCAFCERGSVGVVSPELVSLIRRESMRHIGLDIGRDFAHVAVVEGTGHARRLPRVAMGDAFRAFAATLGPDDAVALEASTNTWALADLLGRHAGRVVVSNPLATRAIAAAKRKTDDIDAATLAELLAADYLPPVWQPDEATQRLRRLTSHRAGLVRDRTAVRNRVAALVSRRLLRPPASDCRPTSGWRSTPRSSSTRCSPSRWRPPSGRSRPPWWTTPGCDGS
jgi:hypothetical protein